MPSCSHFAPRLDGPLLYGICVYASREGCVYTFSLSRDTRLFTLNPSRRSSELVIYHCQITDECVAGVILLKYHQIKSFNIYVGVYIRNIPTITS